MGPDRHLLRIRVMGVRKGSEKVEYKNYKEYTGYCAKK